MKKLFFIFLFCYNAGCSQGSFITQSAVCLGVNVCKDVKLTTELSFRNSNSIDTTERYHTSYIIPIEKLSEKRIQEYNEALKYDRMGDANEIK